MTTLREKFIRELVIRGTSPRTQQSYVAAVYGLAKYYHKAPDQLTDEQLKDYMFYLASERKLAVASLNQTVCALRSFYTLVLQRPLQPLKLALPTLAGAVRRPQVFAIEELERLFTVGCLQPKHRAFLMTVYGAGLRLGEACRLQPGHILSARMQIRIEQGKGRKDRYAMRSPKLLELLRDWYRIARPAVWLFPGGDQMLPMSTRQFNRAVHAAADAGSVRRVLGR